SISVLNLRSSTLHTFKANWLNKTSVNFSSSKPPFNGIKHGQPNGAQKERSVTLTVWSGDQRWAISIINALCIFSTVMSRMPQPGCHH
ncbi:hypothetical protein BX616_001506, partial [Lobosporangium transversale]